MNPDTPLNDYIPRWTLIFTSAAIAACVYSLVLSNAQAQSHNDYQRPALMRGGLNIQPKVTEITPHGDSFDIKWEGVAGPFQLQQLTDFVTGTWTDVGTPLPGREATVEKGLGSDPAIFRLTMTPNYVGAEKCAFCHSVAHSHWEDTHHAKALDTLKAIGRDTNSRCLTCHTVGYGQPTGFVSEEETPQFVGVQCENCHGPGGDHAANPLEVAPPIVEMASEMCGGCHTGTHHGFYDDWAHSSHSKAVVTLKSNPYAGDHCLQCHSQDYRQAKAAGLPTPTVETAKLSLECTTCHSPHGNVESEHLLRKPIASLCGECHTVGESLLGHSPHHPQFEMIRGTGAFNEDGSPLSQRGGHSILFMNDLFPEGKGCAQCHIVEIHPEQVNQGNPVRTGHTFNPFDESIPNFQEETQYQGCTLCHQTSWVSEHRVSVQAEISDFLDELAPYFDSHSDQYIDPGSLSESERSRYDVAKFNYQFVDADGSQGIHNSTVARVALQTSKRIIQSFAE